MTEENKIEVDESTSEPIEIGAPVEKPTRESLKQEGWGAEELELAEKRGMVRKDGEEKPKSEAKPKESAPVKEEKAADERRAAPRSTVPNFVLPPEKEKQFYELFGPGTEQRAMYVGMKVERQKRQRIEAELESLKKEREQFTRSPAKPVDTNAPDPDDVPLTVRQLKELRQQEIEEQQRRAEETQKVSRVLAEAHQTHEEQAKLNYPDWDKTISLAKDLMSNLDSIADPKTRKRAKRLIEEFQTTAAKAHTLEEDDFNETDIAYEIGRLHPNYGAKFEIDGEEEPTTTETPEEGEPTKANGSQTPEKLKRLEKNTQRRPSSASVPAGNRRSLTPAEITVDHLLKMTPEKRNEFRTKYPDRYAEIARG